jgi:diaminohydroxyphosphoribosylaminopyrimidine deaminase/5-amino-6-(5-phosphoribosylamino)uracil reductase
MEFSTADRAHMARALELAARGRYTTHPNPRVGCVIVSGGEVVGEGWHRVAGGPHAEIVALERAGEMARGATAYLNLEPCSHAGRTGPCAPALVEAGLGRVVTAMGDPNPAVSGEGHRILLEAGIAVDTGLLGDEALALNAGFVSRMARGRPRVTIKLAVSLDGRTAMASGESKWISCEQSRDDVQRLRASSSAILTGVGTVLADDPSLNVRSPDCDTAGRQPLRVVVDSRLRTPAGARLLSLPGETMIAYADAADCGGVTAAGARVVSLPGADGRVDLHGLMRHLAQRECNDILVEAGPVLCGALVAAGLADELVIYLAPHLMGDSARGMFTLPGLDSMADRVQLGVLDVAPLGEDLRVRTRIVRAEQNERCLRG